VIHTAAIDPSLFSFTWAAIAYFLVRNKLPENLRDRSCDRKLEIGAGDICTVSRQKMT